MAAGRLDLSLVRHLAVALVAGIALYVLTEALSPYNNLQLATMAYYFVAVAGLTVLTGQNGQISLGHGALMAVGAYATVKIQNAVSWPLAVVLLAAALVAAAAAPASAPATAATSEAASSTSASGHDTASWIFTVA